MCVSHPPPPLPFSSPPAGAVGALYGPLHGGANEAVLRMLGRIGSVADVPRFLEGVKAKREKLFGFGHRVYKNFDPRAKIIRTARRGGGGFGGFLG